MNEFSSRKIPVTDTIVDSIIDQFVERAKVGKKKYGTDLDRNDLTLQEWIVHMKQELMDGILYLEKLEKLFGNRPL
jgi:hypothetical protein